MKTVNENFKSLDKEFENLFDKIAYKHGYYTIFEDFLDMSINWFCPNYNEDIMNQLRKKYTQEEKHIFGEMIKVWIRILGVKIVSETSTFDYLGYFYEKSAMSKQKGFAQYFTPEHICDFMAQIVISDNSAESLCEPTCGSGRLNLSAHSLNQKLFHVANDLDYTCFKMATLNLMVHGVRGVTMCDDGLFPNRSFRGAFIINDFGRAPYIHYENDYSTITSYINMRLNKGKKRETPTTVNKEFIDIVDKKGQLALF